MIIKYIAIRLAGVVALAALVYSFFIPSAAERQFTRTEAALGRAQSYRMEQTALGNGFAQRWLLEVVCPDREHSLQTAEPAEPRWDSPPSSYIEDIDIGDRWYRKLFKDEEWKGMPRQGGKHCGKVPFVQDGGLPDFKHIRALAHIEKQGLDTVAGETCREWVVTLTQPNGSVKVYDYCINGDDNLPRRIKFDENSFQIILTNWNRPIDIQPPEWSR